MFKQPRTPYGKFDLRKGRFNRWLTRKMRFPERYILGPLIMLYVIGSALAIAWYFNQPKKVEAMPFVQIVEAKDSIPPILHRIAVCESGNKQFNSDGSVVRGKKDKNDVGRFQISLTHYGYEAMRQNLNLLKEEENEKMALWIYANKGTDEWSPSKACWNATK